jgi:CubicO group peptidase (beta-lactamase class C family)
MQKTKRQIQFCVIKSAFTRVVLLLLLFIFKVTICTAQSIESKLDEYINAYVELGKFSGSVLVAKEGKILLSRGYGMANREHGVPNTPQTKFRLGSITKQFTAMTFMQLHEKGLLTIDDPLIKYYPNFPNGEKITIHHLLTHTSGIPNFTSFPEYTKTMMLSSPPEKTIERFMHKSLEFEPGEKFRYSNSGYIVLYCGRPLPVGSSALQRKTSQQELAG